MHSTRLPFYLGLPQWRHPAWHQLGLTSLADYSRWFNCVEGNTTFYAVPSLATVTRWQAMTPDHFRFCLKFPATISHQAALQHCQPLLLEFFHALSPIAGKVGQLWLQLPASFSPDFLPRLWAFLDLLPTQFRYGVEVRHADFFAKGEAEQQLNRGLHQRQINRVIMDSRPVHHAQPHSAAIRDAQSKKPRIPLHVVATADSPLVRFIGGDQLPQNEQWFTPWISKIAEWRQQACIPYLFIHTPDNSDSPQHALQLWRQLTQAIAELPSPPSLSQQNSLF